MAVEEESNSAHQHPPWLETTGQLAAAARQIANHFYFATRSGSPVVIWVEIVGIGSKEGRWSLKCKDRSEIEFEWQIEATEFVQRDGDTYEDIGTYEIPLNASRFACLTQGLLDLCIGETLRLVPMTDAEEVAINKSLLR